MLPALWRARVEPMPGYLLTAVEVDGEMRPRFDPMLDLARFAHRSVVFFYRAEAVLEGVVSAGGEKVGAEVRAELIEPGAWFPASQEMGGSIFEVVRAAAHPDDGHYRMVLPSGLWEITVQAGRMISSTPEKRLLRVELGSREEQSFGLLLAAERDSSVAESPPDMEIEITSPAGPPAAGAVVEVVHVDHDPPRLVARTVADAEGRVLVQQPEEGSYRIVAGHADFLEGERKVRWPDRARAPSPIRVRLAPGGEIHARSAYRDGTPVPGIQIDIERLDRPVASEIADAALETAKNRRAMMTDATGRTLTTGWYAGRYRITARHPRFGEESPFLLGMRGGALTQEAAIDLDDQGSVRIEVVFFGDLVAPTLRLVCADAGLLPLSSSVRVFDASGPLPELSNNGFARAAPLGGGAVVARDHVPLISDDDGLRLSIEPLRPGSYRVAVRPSGFTRWTWLGNTEDPLRALAVELAEGDQTNGPRRAGWGTIAVPCLPALDMVLVSQGRTISALRGLRAHVEARDRTGETLLAEQPNHRLVDGTLVVTGLPSGHQRLRFRAEDDHLLPDAVEEWEDALELYRGDWMEGELAVAGMGGVIELRGQWVAARLVFEGEAWPPVESSGGVLRIPSIPPGRYRVEACMDVACRSLGETWPDVQVVPAETVRLRAR